MYYWDLFQQPIALLQQQDAGDALIDAGLADGPVHTGGVHHRFKGRLKVLGAQEDVTARLYGRHGGFPPGNIPG